VDYQPEELVLVVKAGTPLHEIEKILSEKNQMLAFEPPHLGRFYGTESAGTIGGLVATNLSGPRRVSAGAARDFLLGFAAVSGRGDVFKSGSRVMKNVTGYDLSKLMCGSFGTLAVMTEITLKVLPCPETSSSLSLLCDTLDSAQLALATAFCSDTEPSGGAISRTDEGWQAVIRLEGVDVSVRDRMTSLKSTLQSARTLQVLDKQASEAFWRDWRDISMISDDAEQVYRLSVTPSDAPKIASSLLKAYDLELGFDWMGGLIWIGGKGADLGQKVRQTIKDFGGHATLMRGTEGHRRDVGVFQPQAAPLAALARRIKTAFDPEDILNSGKMGTTGRGA
ncbi:MAG: FAD-binding protein, partial [Candidatus Puniceispirillaceae bacterium]